MQKININGKEIEVKVIEKMIFNAMHKNLIIVDQGTKKYPDYTIKGQDHVIFEITNILKDIKNV